VEEPVADTEDAPEEDVTEDEAEAEDDAVEEAEEAVIDVTDEEAEDVAAEDEAEDAEPIVGIEAFDPQGALRSGHPPTAEGSSMMFPVFLDTSFDILMSTLSRHGRVAPADANTVVYACDADTADKEGNTDGNEFNLVTRFPADTMSQSSPVLVGRSGPMFPLR